MRGIGAVDLLAGLPKAVDVLFALLTQLGDPWFVFSALVLLYWLGPGRIRVTRREGALLAGLAVVALATILVLKDWFALPRPPTATSATAPVWLPDPLGDVYTGIATDDDFGFPSGHALASTVVYGGMARVLDVWERRRRYLAAGAIITTVSLSRVVLGLHYLVDVVTGAAVGVVIIWAAVRWLRDRPDVLFGVGCALSLVAMGIAAFGGYAGEVHEAATGVGSALGGAIAWRVERVPERRISVPVATLGLLVTGGLWGVAYAKEEFPLVVTVLLSAIAFGLIIGLPTLFDRIESRR